MTLQNVHGDPIFTKINKHKKQYEYLTKDIDTEVIIVGGGVTGSIVGYYFSKNNIGKGKNSSWKYKYYYISSSI